MYNLHFSFTIAVILLRFLCLICLVCYAWRKASSLNSTPNLPLGINKVIKSKSRTLWIQTNAWSLFVSLQSHTVEIPRGEQMFLNSRTMPHQQRSKQPSQSQTPSQVAVQRRPLSSGATASVVVVLCFGSTYVLTFYFPLIAESMLLILMQV